MCPEKSGCRHWLLNENKVVYECMKPKRILCLAGQDESEEEEDDDEVEELRF